MLSKEECEINQQGQDIPEQYQEIQQTTRCYWAAAHVLAFKNPLQDDAYSAAESLDAILAHKPGWKHRQHRRKRPSGPDAGPRPFKQNGESVRSWRCKSQASDVHKAIKSFKDGWTSPKGFLHKRYLRVRDASYRRRLKEWNRRGNSTLMLRVNEPGRRNLS